MQKLLYLCVVMIVLAALSAVPTHAQDDDEACPEEDGSVTIEDRVADAPMVLEGTITDVFTYSESLPDQQIAVVNVIQYFKGSGPATITLAGFGQRENCLQPVQTSPQPLVFFVINDAGTYRAYYPLLPNGAYLMTDELREDVLAAAEQDAVTPDPALAANTSALSTAETIATIAVAGPPTKEEPTVDTSVTLTVEAATVIAAQATVTPTPAVTTGTAAADDDDDGESIDILPIVLGVVVLVLMLGGGLLFASRRGSVEE